MSVPNLVLLLWNEQWFSYAALLNKSHMLTKLAHKCISCIDCRSQQTHQLLCIWINGYFSTISTWAIIHIVQSWSFVLWLYLFSTHSLSPKCLSNEAVLKRAENWTGRRQNATSYTQSAAERAACADERQANKLFFELFWSRGRPNAQTALCQLIKPDL